MDGDHTESGSALDVEIARQLLERGFYVFETPRPVKEPKPEPGAAPGLRHPPAASARIS